MMPDVGDNAHDNGALTGISTSIVTCDKQTKLNKQQGQVR